MAKGGKGGSSGAGAGGGGGGGKGKKPKSVGQKLLGLVKKMAGPRNDYVPLRDLRKAMGLSHGDFDKAMNDLRKAWKVTLSPTEGRHNQPDKSLLAAAMYDKGGVGDRDADRRQLVYASLRE